MAGKRKPALGGLGVCRARAADCTGRTETNDTSPVCPVGMLLVKRPTKSPHMAGLGIGSFGRCWGYENAEDPEQCGHDCNAAPVHLPAVP